MNSSIGLFSSVLVQLLRVYHALKWRGVSEIGEPSSKFRKSYKVFIQIRSYLVHKVQHTLVFIFILYCKSRFKCSG